MAHSTSSNRLLIVDDDSAPRETLEMVFSTDYEVSCAASSDEAIAQIKEKPTAVAILDICMPERSGTETAGILKQISPNTQIILLTGFRARETAIKALDTGVSNYLFKPFDLVHLESMVRQCRDRFNFLSFQDTSINQKAFRERNQILIQFKGKLINPEEDHILDLPENIQFDSEPLNCEEVINRCRDNPLESINPVLEYTQGITESFSCSYSVFQPKALVTALLPKNKIQRSKINLNLDNTPTYVLGPEYEIQTILHGALNKAIESNSSGEIKVTAEYQPDNQHSGMLHFKITRSETETKSNNWTPSTSFNTFDLGFPLCENICKKIGAHFTTDNEAIFSISIKVDSI